MKLIYTIISLIIIQGLLINSFNLRAYTLRNKQLRANRKEIREILQNQQINNLEKVTRDAKQIMTNIYWSNLPKFSQKVSNLAVFKPKDQADVKFIY